MAIFEQRTCPSAWGGVPYLIYEGTLDECISNLYPSPQSQRHLHEIHTRDQPPLVTAVLSNAELIIELARLREFLAKRPLIKFYREVFVRRVRFAVRETDDRPSCRQDGR
jgi:hypothetical protein